MKVGRLRIETLIFVLLGLGAFVVIPQVTNQFQTFEWANVAVYLVAIVGLNILTGYSGQISLGNGAFMAIGGYTTALMVYWLPRWNSALDPGLLTYLSIPLGGIIAFVGGLLIGIPALRLRGFFLALATMAFAFAAEQWLFTQSFLTNRNQISPILGRGDSCRGHPPAGSIG